MKSKWWLAQSSGDNRFAVGTGDLEIAIVTGPDEATAKYWAKEVLLGLQMSELARSLKHEET